MFYPKGVSYMRITSIISEYNPFHEGHNYHIKKTKEITCADYLIVIMSGNFTQRGTPTILDKYARTRQALSCGADLVLELPACFATASAEGFAFGAVSILEKLGVVNSLVFGSESGDINSIRQIADFLVEEPPAYKDRLQSFLKQGLSFPKARAKCISEFIPETSEDFLSSSNNILGIEYCRALNYFRSSILPMTITRKDNLYHDENLSEIGKLSSATAIRRTLLNRDTESLELFHSLSPHIPKPALEILKEHWNKTAPVSTKDISLLLKYKLLLENRTTLTKYLDVTSDFADRIYNNLNSYTDFDSFCDLLKTKELTHTRISRSLLHILLDFTKEDYRMFTSDTENSNKTYGQYARILGFRKEATPLLHEIKKTSSIPLISKLSDAAKELEGTALSMLKKDIQAAHIYDSIVSDKFHCSFKNEFQRRLIII